MEGTGSTLYRSLPVESDPGYSIRAVIDRLIPAIAKVEKALAPSFFRRLLGGTSKDHARGVVAAAMEEALAIRGVMTEARKVALHDPNKASLVGSAERLIKSLDLWRDVALEFEEAVFGSDEKLLFRTRKLGTLCHEIKNPASGI